MPFVRRTSIHGREIEHWFPELSSERSSKRWSPVGDEGQVDPRYNEMMSYVKAKVRRGGFRTVYSPWARGHAISACLRRQRPCEFKGENNYKDQRCGAELIVCRV